MQLLVQLQLWVVLPCLQTCSFPEWRCACPFLPPGCVDRWFALVCLPDHPSEALIHLRKTSQRPFKLLMSRLISMGKLLTQGWYTHPKLPLKSHFHPASTLGSLVVVGMYIYGFPLVLGSKPYVFWQVKQNTFWTFWEQKWTFCLFWEHSFLGCMEVQRKCYSGCLKVGKTNYSQ